MAELPYYLFYLGVLAAVIGCGVYLFTTRTMPHPRWKAPKIAPEIIKQAETISGKYRLSDLETVLARMASIGAWGVLMQLHCKPMKDTVGAFMYPNGVELISQSADLNRFRRAGAVVGLEVYLVEAQKDVGYVEIAGSWREIAATIGRVIGEMYNIGEGTEVDVDILG